ncbi:restriction endonuclease subunit S [Metallibacterium sp.]|uniref:restriction endonuclease subunit S n=1 Tax=Metallibacterium sp. TaxID=2940281 RepID=UPI002605209E|nr:restriction endonuclease subunit S [Metallibacterium sp.]
MAMGTKGTKGSSDPSAMARHSRESGNPAPLAFDSMKSLDPRLRGDDGHPSDPATSTALPRLRFPEFRGTDGWDTYLLEDLEGLGWMELGRGNVISNQDIKNIPGNFPIYSSSVKNNGYMGSYGRFMFDEELISWSIDGGGDFFHRPKHKFSVTNVSGYMRLAASNLNYQFIASQLQSLHSKLKFDYQIKAHPSVVRKLYCLAVPKPAEQKKIADCLTSLDEVIGAQQQKVEALKTYKRGLMQQLFPREGETRPRLRFPEFRDAPEWSGRALGPMTIKVGSGITPRGGDKNYKSKGRPFMRSQNVGWGHLLLEDIAFIDESTHASFDGTEIVESDVLLNITGASIGRSAIADFRIVGGNVNQHVCIIRTKSDELSPLLLNQFLISERGQEQIDSFQAGGNRQGLNFAQIRSLEIPLPPSQKEQQRIADCLSSLDAQIAAESHQLAALKTHKQGLMQQLFPAPEAASA